MAVRLLQDSSLPIDGSRLGPVLVASIAPVFEVARRRFRSVMQIRRCRCGQSR